MKMRFFQCKHCKNIISYIKDSGVKVVCCGEPMQEIEPNTVDASLEKHVPIVTVAKNIATVKIGSAEHPMVKEHFIEWIALQTNAGNQRKPLKPASKPEICFNLCEGDKVEAVYSYCNLHGLWKTQI